MESEEKKIEDCNGVTTTEDSCPLVTRLASRRKLVNKIKPLQKSLRQAQGKKEFQDEKNSLDSRLRKSLRRQNKATESEDTSDNANNFQCGICCKYFSDIDSLSSHTKDENCSADLFQCVVCNASFSTADILVMHLAGDHDDLAKPFKCGLCNVAFFENVALISHLREEHKDLPAFYQCRVCLISFKEISELRFHATKNHSNSKKGKYKCGLCDKSFTQMTSLTLHAKQKHTPESSKLVKCSICLSKIPSTLMNKHKLEHEKEQNERDVKGQCETDDQIETEIKDKKRKKGINPNKSTLNKKKTTSKAESTNAVDSNKRRKSGTRVMKKMESDNFCSETEEEVVDVHKLVGGDILEKAVEKRGGRKLLVTKQLTRERQLPLIKDIPVLIEVYKKIDSQTNINIVVYDCDICGQRFQEQPLFIQHREDHFFDGKFCIRCQHCGQVFEDFESLFGHVGKDKCVGYECQPCGKSFALEPLLLTHQTKEHGNIKTNGQLTCMICEKAFDNRTAYLRHATSHSEDKCIQCKICRHAFTTPETLFGHLRTTHSLIPSTRQFYKCKCEICGTAFIKMEAVIKHKEVVHNVEEKISKPIKIIDSSKSNPKENHNKQPLKRTGHWRSAEDDKKRRTCHICHRVFRRFKDVRRHMGTHTKPYLCSHCGKSFPYRYSLDAHIKAYHSAENPYKCEVCNKAFSCQRSLLVHQRIHTGEKPHQCPVCQKRFRQVANLSMHIKLHSTEKPVKCELCDYRCSHQGYLKRHMSTHSTEKKHHCPICNKGFTEKPNLNHHLKRHSNIKKHTCPICGNRFAERYYLNNHMRVHTKEKPYVCPVCSRAFTMRPNMVSHIKNTHPAYNYKPMKRSHQNTTANTNTNMNTLPAIGNIRRRDIEMQLETPNQSSMQTSLHNIPSSTTTNNSIPIISASYPPLPPLLRVTQPDQSSHVPISSDIIPIYPQLHHEAVSKTTPHPFPTDRDLLPHHPALQRESQTSAVSVRETLNQQPASGREHTAMMDQHLRQELERHPNYINLAAVQFDPQREVPGQNYPSVPISSQEYMYTYPNLPPDTAFLQGLFPVPNQQTLHSESKQ